MIEHKFYQLSGKVHGSIAFLLWLPTSVNMSKDDFLEHCEVLNNFINVYYTRILFIDAKDFHAKIEGYGDIVKKLQYVKGQNSLKWIIYTSSNKRLKRLFQELEPEIKLIEHSSRDKLLNAYSELTNN